MSDQPPKRVKSKVKVTEYERTIEPHLVRFTCAACGQEIEKTMYEGATPKYCDDCAPIVRNRQAAERMKAYRERKKADSPTPKRRGRPPQNEPSQPPLF